MWTTTVHYHFADAVKQTPADGVVRITAPKEEDSRRWEARLQAPGEWVIEGKGLERLVAMTDLDNDYALRRFQRTLERAGINRKLKALGAKDGDTVRIRDIEFEYQDEDVHGKIFGTYKSTHAIPKFKSRLGYYGLDRAWAEAMRQI